MFSFSCWALIPLVFAVTTMVGVSTRYHFKKRVFCHWLWPRKTLLLSAKLLRTDHTYINIPISFRWSLCLSFFGLYRPRNFNMAGGPLDFFQLHKKQRLSIGFFYVASPHHPTSECLRKGNLVFCTTSAILASFRLLAFWQSTCSPRFNPTVGIHALFTTALYPLTQFHTPPLLSRFPYVLHNMQ